MPVLKVLMALLSCDQIRHYFVKLTWFINLEWSWKMVTACWNYGCKSVLLIYW